MDITNNVNQFSKELPKAGIHNATIVDVLELPDNRFAVKFELEEKDSEGKAKFAWQEFSYEEMLELRKTLGLP